MKWLKNLETLAESGSVGACPHCGSSDTDHCYTVIDGRMGYCDLWCNSCKHGFHISRTLVSEDAKVGIAPNGIIY